MLNNRHMPCAIKSRLIKEIKSGSDPENSVRGGRDTYPLARYIN